MMYTAEIKNNELLNEFKKAVEKTGKSESEVLVQWIFYLKKWKKIKMYLLECVINND